MKYLLGMVNYTLLFLYSGKLGIIVKKDSNGQPRIMRQEQMPRKFEFR